MGRLKPSALLLLAPLVLAGRLDARVTVVLGKTDVRDLAAPPAAAPPLSADQSAFLAAVKKAVAASQAFGESRALVNPPSWGKTVRPDSGGILRYHAAFPGGFVCHLTLEHLLPEHRYLLTLNGVSGQAGNELLPDPVPGFPNQNFYDFLTVRTDAQGRCDATIAVFLKRGEYAVRFFVKDTSDFKIVLHRETFRFVVQ